MEEGISYADRFKVVNIPINLKMNRVVNEGIKFQITYNSKSVTRIILYSSNILQNMNFTTVLYKTKRTVSVHKINKLLNFKQERQLNLVQH